MTTARRRWFIVTNRCSECRIGTASSKHLMKTFPRNLSPTRTVYSFWNRISNSGLFKRLWQPYGHGPASATPWSRVLHKLVVSQLVKKFTAFYRTRRFITVFTTAWHWSLFWATWIQSTTHSHPVSLRSISVFPSTARYPEWSLPYEDFVQIIKSRRFVFPKL